MANAATLLLSGEIAPQLVPTAGVSPGDLLQVISVSPLVLGFAPVALPTVVVLGADFTTSSATYVDVTGLTAAVVAGTYWFSLTAQVDDTAAGANVGVNGPTLVTLTAISCSLPNMVDSGAAYDTGLAGSVTGSTVFLQGILRVSAAGTFAIRLLDGAGAGVATMRRGATLMLQKVA